MKDESSIRISKSRNQSPLIVNTSTSTSQDVPIRLNPLSSPIHLQVIDRFRIPTTTLLTSSHHQPKAIGTCRNVEDQQITLPQVSLLNGPMEAPSSLAIATPGSPHTPQRSSSQIRLGLRHSPYSVRNPVLSSVALFNICVEALVPSSRFAVRGNGKSAFFGTSLTLMILHLTGHSSWTSSTYRRPSSRSLWTI